MNTTNLQKIIVCHPSKTGQKPSSKVFIITTAQLHELLKQEWAYDGTSVRGNNVTNIFLNRSLYYDKEENKFITRSAYEKRKKEKTCIS